MASASANLSYNLESQGLTTGQSLFCRHTVSLHEGQQVRQQRKDNNVQPEQAISKLTFSRQGGLTYNPVARLVIKRFRHNRLQFRHFNRRTIIISTSSKGILTSNRSTTYHAFMRVPYTHVVRTGRAIKVTFIGRFISNARHEAVVRRVTCRQEVVNRAKVLRYHLVPNGATVLHGRIFQTSSMNSALTVNLGRPFHNVVNSLRFIQLSTKGLIINVNNVRRRRQVVTRQN